ncbi:hypothetical protein CL634_01240 [bacterium]|nr:hypothetical protein [bacterium]
MALLQGTTVTGNLGVTGTIGGQGAVPVGGIIALHSGMSGAHSVPSAAAVDADGWMICDGSTIPSSQTLSGDLPDLTDARFLQGNTHANVGGEAGGTHTLTTSEIAAHTHTGAAHTHTGAAHTHTAAAHTHGGGNHTHGGGNHTHSFSGAQGHTHSHTSHQHHIYIESTVGRFYGSGGQFPGTYPWRHHAGGGNGSSNSTTVTISGTTGGGSATTGGGSATTGSTTPGASGSTTPGASASTTPGAGGSTGGGGAHNVIPKYLRVVYLMRVI